MRPERNAAFVQSIGKLRGRRFENRGAGDDHLELSVHPAQPRQHSLTHFAGQFYRKAASFTFGWDAVLGKARGAKFPREGRRTRAVSNDLDLVVFGIDVLKISVVDAL